MRTKRLRDEEMNEKSVERKAERGRKDTRNKTQETREMVCNCEVVTSLRTKGKKGVKSEECGTKRKAGSRQ